MAASNHSCAYAKCTKIRRFSTQDGFRPEFIDVPRDGRCLAVSGYKDDTDDAFIDLFTLKPDPESQGISLFMTSQPYFSKVFSKTVGSKWRWRYVCLMDDSELVTCCGNTIESYDTVHGHLINQCNYTGEASCITTRDGRIYVGLLSSKDVIVFDRKLNQINTITLKGLVFDYPEDMTITKNKLFICTGYYRKALIYNINGDIEFEFKEPVQQYNGAIGITVSEENGLIYILGWAGRGKCVVVYSLVSGHPFLPGRHSSFSWGVSALPMNYSFVFGCHCLALFDVSDDSHRIRVNNNVNRLFVVTEEAGEIYEYNVENIISLGNLLRLMESLIDEDDCEKLLKYFKVPADKAKTIKNSDEPSSSLFQHLTETDKLPPGDISLLLKACNEKGIIKVIEVWNNYQHFLAYQGQLLPYHLKESKKQRLLLTEKLSVAEDERQQLAGILETKEDEMQQIAGRLTDVEREKQRLLDERKQLTDKVEAADKERKQELEDTKSSLRVAKDQLVKSQMKYAKESIALQEVLEQTRQALNRKQISSTVSAEDLEGHPSSKQTDTSEISHESAALAADYGRLLVDVANDLTLDSTLQLAYLFDLPLGECDMLRRISLIETPGMSLINFLKKRKMINMYDVTNLQKGLIHLHLYSTNERYVVPYQQKVEPFQNEENRSPELIIDSLDKTTDAPIERETTAPNSFDEKTTTESKYDHNHNEKRSMETTERQMSRQNSETLQNRQPYIEQKINNGGGTITVMGVYLSIPNEALSDDHIIAMTVIHDPNIHLPGGALMGRMTPLIKLEPEGLKLNKPARLIIPHSAIIPAESDGHRVIVFNGQSAQGRFQKGQINWTEEKSSAIKLENQRISLDIIALNNIFVSLVSQEIKQKHVFRVVPLIDGILDTKDDVLITVCFCKDNDAEYQVLLQDHKSKLTLGHYATFQVSRPLNEIRGEGSHLDLVMLSQGGDYMLYTEDAKKFVDIGHLCTASRVAQQFRLKRRRDTDIGDGIIDVELEISQGEEKETALILQSKVKNILLSPRSQGLLLRQSNNDLQQYEDLKTTLSRLLTKHHCKTLAVFFQLTTADKDRILNDANPGEILIETLDERELIMADKMIGLYEGLKACSIDRIGRHVMNYIEASKKGKIVKSVLKQSESKQNELETLQGSNFSSTKYNEVLTEEGFDKFDVQHALKLSHGKLHLGRRLLLLAKDEHERYSVFPASTLYKEQYIDERGGDLIVAGIHLRVPTGALHIGRIVSLMVSADPDIKGPISNESLRLAPFVKFGPEDVTFQKPVTMIIPHCAFITSEQKGTDVYPGVLLKDRTIQWNLQFKQVSCSMNNHHLEVTLQTSCLIGLHIPYHSKMRKRVCVVPIMKRLSNLENEPLICLWFYNDDKLEYDSLINDEVCRTNDIKINDPVSVLLESMGSNVSIIATYSTPQSSSYSKTLDVDMGILWSQNRHKVEFHLQNIDRKDTVNLAIEARVEASNNLFSFHVTLKKKDLLHPKRIMSPFQHKLPQSVVESYKNLTQRLPESLTRNQSIHLANIFHLAEDVISSIEEDAKPGFLLLRTLDKRSLISPANVSTLESALTEQEYEECVKLVRDFRKNNPVIEPISCQEYDG